MGRNPRPLLGWRGWGRTALGWDLFPNPGVEAWAPVSTGSPHSWVGTAAVCSAVGLCAAPTVPLIGWLWPWQEQQAASPGCPGPSTDLARLGTRGPHGQQQRAPALPSPGSFLLPVGSAPSRGWLESGSFYLSWPGRVAALIWADSSWLQTAPGPAGGMPVRKGTPLRHPARSPTAT